MQALVLVGGHGTRLRPITLTIPKPVIPLVDRPFIGYMVDWLARHGVDDIIMACGFLPDALRDALGDGPEGGPRIRYVQEPEPRGTAGAIKFAEDLLEDRFFALNGDVLTDLDLTKLRARHETSGARGTLALYPVEDPTGYGLVHRKEDGEITEFLEKPEPAEIDTDEISAGAYFLEKSVLDLIPPDQDVSIERDVFPRLVGNGLYSQRLEGFWMDIGNPERYLQACWDILAGDVESEPGRLVNEEGVYISPSAMVDAAAAINGPTFVNDGARIEAGAVVGPKAILGPGTVVGRRAVVAGSALHADCRLGQGATVAGGILAARVEVEAGAIVPEGSVIGEGATIGVGADLEPGARIQPGETV